MIYILVCKFARAKIAKTASAYNFFSRSNLGTTINIICMRFEILFGFQTETEFSDQDKLSTGYGTSSEASCVFFEMIQNGINCFIVKWAFIGRTYYQAALSSLSNSVSINENSFPIKQDKVETFFDENRNKEQFQSCAFTFHQAAEEKPENVLKMKCFLFSQP